MTPATSTLLGRRLPKTRWKRIAPKTAKERVSWRVGRGGRLTSEDLLDPVPLERLRGGGGTERRPIRLKLSRLTKEHWKTSGRPAGAELVILSLT